MRKNLLLFFCILLLVMPAVAQTNNQIPIELDDKWKYSNRGKTINETVIDSFTHKDQEYIEINTTRKFAFPYSFDASTENIALSFDMIQKQQSLFLSKYGGIPIAPSSDFDIIISIVINNETDNFVLSTNDVSFENKLPQNTNQTLYLELCRSIYCEGINSGIRNKTTVEHDMTQYFANNNISIIIESNTQLIPINDTDFQLQYDVLSYTIKTHKYTITYSAVSGALSVGFNKNLQTINHVIDTKNITPIKAVQIHYDNDHIPSRIIQTEPIHDISNSLHLSSNNLVTEKYILQSDDSQNSTSQNVTYPYISLFILIPVTIYTSRYISKTHM